MGKCSKQCRDELVHIARPGNHVFRATRCEDKKLMSESRMTSKSNVDTGLVLEETREASASAPSESEK